MELPIIHTDAASSPPSLLRTAKKALATLAECTVEPELVAGCTAFCAPERGSVPWVNAVFDLHLAEGRPADEIVGAVENHFSECGGRCRLVMSAGEDFEPELREELIKRGYEASTASLLIMQALIYPRQIDKGVQILPARAVRQQYEQFALSLSQERRQLAPGVETKDDSAAQFAWRGPAWFEGAVAEEAAACLVDQLDDARLDVHLARVDKEPVALASVLSQGDVGVLQHVDRLRVEAGDAALVRVLADVFELCSRAQFKTLCALVTAEEEIKGDVLTGFGMVKVAETPVFVQKGNRD